MLTWSVMIFVVFHPFSSLSPKCPHSFHSNHDMFSFPLPYTIFVLSYLSTSPLFYLTQSFQHTWRLVSLGLLKEFYLLRNYWPVKPHCEDVGTLPLKFLQGPNHLWQVQDLGQHQQTQDM